MILTIRTDKPEAELGLFRSGEELEYMTWQADRKLSKDLHRKLAGILERQKAGYGDLRGIILFRGPGSFTGLRIGASVGNALAYGLDIPIAGGRGEAWIKEGLAALSADPARRMALPEYGSEPRTTKPKK